MTLVTQPHPRSLSPHPPFGHLLLKEKGIGNGICFVEAKLLNKYGLIADTLTTSQELTLVCLLANE